MRRQRLSPSGGYRPAGTLVINAGPLSGRRVPVLGEVVLGRAADVVIDDPEISRRHAALRSVDGSLEIEDLGSANGTWVNGERITNQRPLATGDVVRLGRTVIEVELAPDEATSAPSLVATQGPLEGRRLPVGSELVVGREAGDVTIDDLEISRRHAVFRADGGRVTVEDLGSRNGTWVNSERVRGMRTVEPGDVVRLGRTTLRLDGSGDEPTESYALVEGLLARLADGISRRRLAVCAAWVAVIAASGWFAVHQSDYLSGGGWEVSGSEPERANELLRGVPGAPGSNLSVFVTGSSAEAVRDRAAEVRAGLAGEADLRVGELQELRQGTVALLPIAYTGRPADETEAATSLRERFVATTPTTQTRVIGTAAVWSNVRDVTREQLAKSEALGFPLILVILVAGFGTLVAAVMPLGVGFVTVFVGAAIIYGLSRVVDMSVYVTNMASMIGIGVAVDYSLFVVSHFRHELQGGRTREAALRRALASSGTAVVFSGVTVALALAGLFLIEINAIRSMAIGAIVVVLVAVLASVTFLPALLALLGPRVDRLRIRVPWSTGEGGGQFWAEWTRRVLARPGRWLIVGAAGMIALAVPTLYLETASRGLEQLPPDAEVREATERAVQAVGPGATGPTHVFFTATDAADEFSQRVASFPGVARVGEPIRRTAGDFTVVNVVLDSEPESEGALATLARLEEAADIVAAGRGADAVVGGATATVRESDRTIAAAMWSVIAFILALAYVVLFVLLRSVLMPLKAVAMNLLSVGAAYGTLVMIFQWGWLDWTGYNSPGYIDVVVPPLLLAVTFGLSMDYEVFLLTRIRERYQQHGSNDLAVTEGVVSSARIITSAALIMVAVFGAFAFAGATSLKQLGVGLAVAVLLDATVVRLVIVPSTMRLLGDLNWWLPERLTRVLPAVSPGEG